MHQPYALRIVTGPDAGRDYPLGPAGLTIGRQGGCDIVLSDPNVSRRHARVELRAGQIVATDLGSGNGTLLDGRPIAGPTLLQPGQAIQIGGTTLLLAAAAPAVAPPPQYAPPPQHYPPPPPPAAPKRPLGLILGGVGALLLLCCVAVAALVVVAGRGGDPTPTPAVASGAPSAAPGVPAAGSSAPGAAPGGSSQPRANYARGTVLDARGQPIRVGRVEVRIVGTTTQAGQRAPIYIQPDANGYYERELPQGSYSVAASVIVTWEGQQFTLAADPTDGVINLDYDSKQGIVRDFRWPLTGPVAGRGNAYWHGVQVKLDGYDTCSVVQSPTPGCRLPEDAQVTLTFTPLGPLVDGSTGTPKTFTATGKQILADLTLPEDLPLAKYRLTATATRGGAPLAVALACAATGSGPGDPTAPSCDVTPVPDGSAIRPIRVIVGPGK